MVLPTLTGIGDATCPSAEQLAGIVDINDPCQFPSVPGTATTQEIVAVSPTVSVASAALSCPAGSTCTIISGVPDTAVYTLGAILAVFLFMGVSGK